MKEKILVSVMAALIAVAPSPVVAADDITQESVSDEASMQPPLMPVGMMKRPGSAADPAMPMPPMIPVDVPACTALHAEIQVLSAEIKAMSAKIDKLESAAKK